MLICQEVYLSAFVDYLEHGGKSRGSALYTDFSGINSHESLPNLFSFSIDDGSRHDLVQEVIHRESTNIFTWRDVRPIPQEDDFFESVWREFRKSGNVF